MVRGARASDHWGVRSFGEQAGQATLERQVVAAGVVALSGALVTAVPAVAPHITSTFQTLIPRVGGGSCAVSPPTAPPAPARPPATGTASGGCSGRPRPRSAAHADPDSPVEMSRALDKPLATVSHHMRLLRDLGYVELLRTRHAARSSRSSTSGARTPLLCVSGRLPAGGSRTRLRTSSVSCNTSRGRSEGVCAFDRDYLGQSRPPPRSSPKTVEKHARFAHSGAHARGGRPPDGAAGPPRPPRLP